MEKNTQKKWWEKNKIDCEDTQFQKIIYGLLFECPASTVKTFNANKGIPNSKKKMEKKLISVSNRKCSFHDRKINNGLLQTLLAQIKKPLKHNKSFIVVEKDDNVDQKLIQFENSQSLKDENYEIVILRKRKYLSISDAFYYDIRNAFAHGSFEMKKTAKGYVYLLECDKDSRVESKMRLKESTLQRYVELAQQTPEQIRNQQKNKKR
jgi:hypothetical protein